MLHNGFGRRLKSRCALYVLFTFNQPAISAGWWFEPSAVGGLAAKADELVGWLQSLDPSFNIVETTDWDHRPTPLDRSLVTADWLRDRLENKGWFRVERSWPPDAVLTTAPVIGVLIELAESLLADGSVLEGLEAEGTLDRSQATATVPLEPTGLPEIDEEGGAPAAS
jgi:hypothetical protein